MDIVEWVPFTLNTPVPNGVRSCHRTCTLALLMQGNLMIDSTGFRTGGNKNAASIIQSVGVRRETCEKSATWTNWAIISCDPSRSPSLSREVIILQLLKKAAQQGRSERRGEEVRTALRVCRSPVESNLANGKTRPVLPRSEMLDSTR